MLSDYPSQRAVPRSGEAGGPKTANKRLVPGEINNTALSPDVVSARDFANSLSRAGHPIWTRPNGGFPKNWERTNTNDNAKQIANIDDEAGRNVAVVLGPGAFAVVDVDTDDDGNLLSDPDDVESSLQNAGVCIAARVTSGSGGVHLYVPCSPEHVKDRTRPFQDFPGVDFKTQGIMFLPGSRRKKHNHAPYAVVWSNLDDLRTDPDKFLDSQASFTGWLDEHLAPSTTVDRQPEKHARLPEHPQEIAQVKRQVEAAVEEEVRRIAEAPEGQRDTTFARVVFKLGRYAHLEDIDDGEIVSREAVWNLVRDACEQNGMANDTSDNALRDKFDRQWDAGDRKGRREVPFDAVNSDFDPNTLPSSFSESEPDSEDAPNDLTAMYEATADLLDAAGVLKPRDRATDQVKLTMISELARAKAREIRTQSERARLRPVIPVGRSMADPMPEEIPDLLGGLLPYEGRANMFAAYKGGKTSTVVNLIWSLTTGEPYLGRFPLERGPLKVALLDTEMTEGTLRSWLAKRGVCADGEKFKYWILRGAVSAFDPLDDDNRAQWADLLAPFDFIILDNLRPSLDALGLDENSEIGKYLTHFDMLVKEAGAVGSMIVHHAGHADNGRGRGDSAFMASNDVFISLSTGDVKGADVTSQTPRYFSARGRLGDVPRSRVVFDPDTVTVKLAGQNDDPMPPAWNAVKELLLATPAGLSETNLYRNRGDNDLLTRTTIPAALNWAMRVGLVEKKPAGGKGHVYALIFRDDEPLDES